MTAPSTEDEVRRLRNAFNGMEVILVMTGKWWHDNSTEEQWRNFTSFVDGLDPVAMAFDEVFKAIVEQETGQ